MGGKKFLLRTAEKDGAGVSEKISKMGGASFPKEREVGGPRQEKKSGGGEGRTVYRVVQGS